MTPPSIKMSLPVINAPSDPGSTAALRPCRLRPGCPASRLLLNRRQPAAGDPAQPGTDRASQLRVCCSTREVGPQQTACTDALADVCQTRAGGVGAARTRRRASDVRGRSGRGTAPGTERGCDRSAGRGRATRRGDRPGGRPPPPLRRSPRPGPRRSRTTRAGRTPRRRRPPPAIPDLRPRLEASGVRWSDHPPATSPDWRRSPGTRERVAGARSSRARSPSS